MGALLVTRWLLLLWLAGWLALPLSRRLWRSTLADGGLAAGRVLFLCGWSMVAFWAGNAGMPSRWSALLVYPVGAALVVCWWRDWPGCAAYCRRHRGGILLGEGLFAAAFVAFLVFRCYWPD